MPNEVRISLKKIALIFFHYAKYSWEDVKTSCKPIVPLVQHLERLGSSLIFSFG
jgi:hypothetical protein